MKDCKTLLALLGLLCAGTLVSSADTGWSEEFLLDNVTPGTTFELQTTDPIAASTLWVEGTARTATVTADAEGVPTITPEIFSLTEGQETCQAWDYTQIPAGTMPRDKTYTLTHEIKDGGVSKATETATVTILPEPCLALVLGLAGLMLFGRRMRKAALALALVATMASSAATVTDVKCQQRWPWNGKVDIDYALSSDESKPTFEVSFAGKIGEGEEFALTTLEGAGASGTITGAGTYRTTWDSAIDMPGTDISNIKIGVTAQESTVLFGDYMKIDLSTGSVTYFKNIAEPKWTTDDKTKYLWLRRIPATTEYKPNGNTYFAMGSPTDELGRNASREAQHNVTLTKDFYIGVFQLTEAQYNYITNSIAPGTSTTVKRSISYNNLRGTSSGSGWPTSTDVDEGSLIYKLRDKTSGSTPSGYRFDLPTDAQWEYACRGPLGWGSTWNDGSEILSSTEEDANLNDLGWYTKNSDSSVQAVGQKTPNGWGLYDMHGNVFEWCLDWYAEDITSYTSDPKGPTNGNYRVIRGGCWNSDASGCRSAFRGIRTPGSNYGYDGARVALVQ